MDGIQILRIDGISDRNRATQVGVAAVIESQLNGLIRFVSCIRLGAEPILEPFRILRDLAEALPLDSRAGVPGEIAAQRSLNDHDLVRIELLEEFS